MTERDSGSTVFAARLAGKPVPVQQGAGSVTLTLPDLAKGAVIEFAR